jgi:hypothetical protein
VSQHRRERQSRGRHPRADGACAEIGEPRDRGGEAQLVGEKGREHRLAQRRPAGGARAQQQRGPRRGGGAPRAGREEAERRRVQDEERRDRGRSPGPRVGGLDVGELRDQRHLRVPQPLARIDPGGTGVPEERVARERVAVFHHAAHGGDVVGRIAVVRDRRAEPRDVEGREQRRRDHGRPRRAAQRGRRRGGGGGGAGRSRGARCEARRDGPDPQRGARERAPRREHGEGQPERARREHQQTVPRHAQPQGPHRRQPRAAGRDQPEANEGRARQHDQHRQRERHAPRPGHVCQAAAREVELEREPRRDQCERDAPGAAADRAPRIGRSGRHCSGGHPG